MIRIYRFYTRICLILPWLEHGCEHGCGYSCIEGCGLGKVGGQIGTHTVWQGLGQGSKQNGVYGPGLGDGNGCGQIRSSSPILKIIFLILIHFSRFLFPVMFGKIYIIFSRKICYILLIKMWY